MVELITMQSAQSCLVSPNRPSYLSCFALKKCYLASFIKEPSPGGAMLIGARASSRMPFHQLLFSFFKKVFPPFFFWKANVYGKFHNKILLQTLPQTFIATFQLSFSSNFESKLARKFFNKFLSSAANPPYMWLPFWGPS